MKRFEEKHSAAVNAETKFPLHFLHRHLKRFALVCSPLPEKGKKYLYARSFLHLPPVNVHDNAPEVGSDDKNAEGDEEVMRGADHVLEHHQQEGGAVEGEEVPVVGGNKRGVETGDGQKAGC